MKLKFIFFCVFISFTNLYSQLRITEVYYNTPYNEKLKFGNQINGYVDAIKHHRGEFIEIYNYSDKDINLKNWYIKDRFGIFWFPEKVIKSGQFIVVAYSTLPSNTTPFTEYFTTTVGKQDQIILQNQIILRNKYEQLRLGYLIGGSALAPVNKSDIAWEFRSEPNKNFVNNIWSTPSEFYNVKSIQYNPSYVGNQDNPDLYDNYTATPNPLDATYKPPIQSYESIVKDDFQQYYSFLDWSDNVNALVNRVCQLSIEKTEQSPNGIYNSGGKCFSYDIAGNRTVAIDCTATNPATPNNGYNTDELEAIKNSIFVYPNPATPNNGYIVNISWNGPSINKISNLQVYSSGGGLVYGFSPTAGVNSTNFSLQGQLPGVFVVNFTLNTGQVVSKNILKW